MLSVELSRIFSDKISGDIESFMQKIFQHCQENDFNTLLIDEMVITFAVILLQYFTHNHTTKFS